MPDCDPDGTGGGGPNPDDLQTDVIDLQIEEADDGTSEPNVSLSPSSYEPVFYHHHAEVTRLKSTYEVISVYPYPTTAEPLSSLFIDNEGLNGVRTLTLLGHVFAWERVLAQFVEIQWKCFVHALYIRSAYDFRTRQWEHIAHRLY